MESSRSAQFGHNRDKVTCYHRYSQAQKCLTWVRGGHIVLLKVKTTEATMLNRCSRACGWTLLLALMVGVPAAAQNTVGEISGYVRDTGGGALPGVDVRICFPAIRVERGTPTNTPGLF